MEIIIPPPRWTLSSRNDIKIAKKAVKIYEKIFTAENKLRDLFRKKKIPETDFLRLRQEKVKPIFDTWYERCRTRGKTICNGQKNFLFSGSGIGARSTCFIFTLIETAKANNKNPEDYLSCLFEKAPYAQTNEDWNKLLPWNIEITPFKMRGEWIE